MATVTGMTAAAMMAIRDGTIVSAAFDSSNHLILTKYDGSTVDGGVIAAATTSASGLVELATSTETQTGTDTVRAVTPAGLLSTKLLTANAVAESALPTSYPTGLSVMSLTTSSGWSVNSGFGSVVTSKSETDRTVQLFYPNPGGTGFSRTWIREYHSTNGGGGWTAWSEYSMIATLTPASFTQTTAFTSYPSGWSRLYYTSSGTGWDFSGSAGEVMTYVNGSDFAKQTFTLHASGSGTPEMWIRTANAASGWTAWRKFFTDQGAWTSYTPTWTGNTTNPAIGNGTIAGRYIKLGRTVTFGIAITAGSTTTYGSGGYNFGLPVAAANAGISMIGNCEILLAQRWTGAVLISPGVSTASVWLPSATNVSNVSQFDASTPTTMASGHVIRISATYEAAS